MRRRILKTIYIIFIFIFILIFGTYFLLRSNYFLENYVFPAITTATGVRINAENIILKPSLSCIELSEFNININSEFNIKGKTIYIEYGLWSLLNGKLDINQLILDDSVFDIKIRNIEGEKNNSDNLRITLNPLNSYLSSIEAIRNLHIKNCTVNIELLKSRPDDFLKLVVKKINIVIPELLPGSDSQIKYSADFEIYDNKMIDLKGGIKKGFINCHFKERIKPATIIANLTINNITGFVRGVHLSNRTMKMKLLLDVYNNYIEVKTFELKDISKVDELIANINIKSKIELFPFESDIDILKCNLSPEFLNLFGSLWDIDFNTTHLNYHGKLIYSYEKLCSDGLLTLANFSYSTLEFNPFENNVFNINFKHDFSLNKNHKSFNVNELSLKVYDKNDYSNSIETQNNIKNSDHILKDLSLIEKNTSNKHVNNDKLVGNKIIDFTLSEPVSYLWLDEQLLFKSKVPNITLKLFNFNMNSFANIFARYFDIQYFTGLLNANILMIADKNCNIKVTGNTIISNLNSISKKYVLNDLTINNRVSLDIKKLSNVIINKFNTSLEIKGKKVTDTQINGSYDLSNNNGEFELFVPFLNRNYTDLLSQKIKSIDNYKNFGALLDQCSLKLFNKIKLDIKKKDLIIDFLDIELYKQTKRTAYFSFKDSFIINLDDLTNIIQPIYSGVLEVSDMSLTDFNCLSNNEHELVILSGKLNSILHCDINIMRNNIKTYGDVSIDNLSFKSDNKKYENIELQQNIDLTFDSFSKLKLNKINLNLLIDEELALSSEINGSIDFINSLGSTKSIIKKYSAEVINKLPIYILQDILCIKTMLCAGTILFDYTDNMDTFSVDCKLKGTGLSFFELNKSKKSPLIFGDIDFNIKSANNELSIRSFDCNLYVPRGLLGNLHADGKLIISNNEGKSNLNISSKGMMLQEMLQMFYSLKGKFNGVFKNADFNSELRLKNITYGPYLNFNCTGFIDFSDGFLKAEHIDMNLNDSTLKGLFYYDFKPDKNNYFKLETKGLDVDIKPILKTFHPVKYSQSGGIISNVSIMLEGRGIEVEDLEQYFNGRVDARIYNIKIPDNRENYDYIRLLFLPLEVISQLRVFFKNSNLPMFLISLIYYSNSIFQDTQYLHLKSSHIKLDAKDGRVHLDNCIFNGNGKFPIELLEFNGTVGFDDSINLDVILKVNQFVSIPIHIEGTVNQPQPDYYQCAIQIIDNIIKPVGTVLKSSVYISEKAVDDVVDETGVLINVITP